MPLGSHAVVGAGGDAGVGDNVHAIFYGDSGCIGGVLRVFKEAAAAAAGLVRVEPVAEKTGWGVWAEEITVE